MKYGTSLKFILSLSQILLIFCATGRAEGDPSLDYYSISRRNAGTFEESASAISQVLSAVLNFADKETLLVPDLFFPTERDWTGRVNKHRYSPHNSGADLYPHLVITSSFIDPMLYRGRMMQMLRNEIIYTDVKDGVPGTFDFNTRKRGKINLFSGAEYMKDGVMPITEFLGRTPWFDRMRVMAEGVMENGRTQSKFGILPSSDSELNGDMLQVFARLIPMTADSKFLEYSRRISDAYIYEAVPGSFNLVPTKWNFSKHTGNKTLRLRDHGNETLVGLVSAAAIEQSLNSDRAKIYLDTVEKLLDRTLASANSDGFLYNVIDAETLQPPSTELADNWGYVYGAIYSYYMISGDVRFRDATIKVLKNLSKYKGYPWEGQHYDGIADSVESALYLLAREPVPEGFDFVESEIQRMLALQRKDGHIDQSYLEGNFNRTLIMYMMYKSQGILPLDWESGVGIGANKTQLGIKFSVINKQGKGKVALRFDSPRHRLFLNFPKNYPRVNEFPEWYTVEPNQVYSLTRSDNKKSFTYLGSELIMGVDLEVGDWEIQRL